ncbi:phenylalanine--tRNA ligase beta subunit [mine drainage metagenome]|uniref:Phenylalanine--tRNA ligase beta subunit n=1 Tax=mine drainage metagenome TaxID=410659 RepID=A0A1J5QBP2_9ZZZZ
MKFSEHWLRSFVNPALDSEQLDHVLTMAGLEVEAREPVAPDFSQVVVAKILSAEKHPDADRLQICRVDVGQAESLQIVCGASNARPGLTVPCAMVGAVLPGFNIKQAKVRGIESFGMLCSAKELGLAEESSGLLELPLDAPVGQDIRSYLDLDDRLFTLKLTPNRSDCLSILGVARDVAALTGAALTQPRIPVAVAQHQAQKKVVVEQPASCPRYCGRIIRGVNASAPTPSWMLQRLERSGLRSISAVVDITNYVLLELGQPLHAFDLARLTGDLRVRMARAGEKIDLLNGQAAELAADMLVIADDGGAVALAGIMGGAATAVSAATTDIFLESAFFAPSAITGKARQLGLSTDSSFRFERGVDFAATRQALERATQLVTEICGGEAGPVTEVAAQLPARHPIRLRVNKARDILGIPLDHAVVRDVLERLKFQFVSAGDEFQVTPPSYRFDLAIEEDLVEEIVRMHGYEHVPALSPQFALGMLPSVESRLRVADLRRSLVAAGYHEAVTYSFVDETWEHNLQGNAAPIRLRNPIASNMSVMRSSLWGGLIDALLYNLNRRQERVRLFEIGACFAAAGGGYAEVTRVAGLCYGSVAPEQWGESAREVDFYDIKTDVETLTRGRAGFDAGQHPALHPGQSARVMMAGRCIGWMGGLHPQWQQHYQLPRGVMLFELEVDALLERGLPAFSGVAKFPPVRRDLALVVGQDVPAQAVLDAMMEARAEVVNEIALFDQYRGKGVGDGQKSLAFRVVMQDTQKTLTDEEVDSAVAQLVAAAAQKYGAELRS